MVFSELHWIPSAIAAILTMLLPFVKDKSKHKFLGFAMAFFAIIGLAGYLSQQAEPMTFSLSILNLHMLFGAAALAVSLLNFVLIVFFKKWSRQHCQIGYLAAVLAFVALLLGVLLLLGLENSQPAGLVAYPGNLTSQVPTSSTLPEVEATEFQGVQLTPISAQANNAINGTQYIDRSTYRLQVTGLVENNLSMSYDQLLQLPAYSEVAYLPCVEGWGFNAKWTGFRVMDLLNEAKLEPNASYVVFYGADGYSTGEPITYLEQNNILMAYGLNDVTLPPDRGFPFQLVAESKYGYKWGKWITKIEVVNTEVEGYWESRGYSNSGYAGSFPYG
jgi:DMSO/TMAO reductase YedYZ molybdopterin-dependent catalytic subunit